jgi:putative oxidoreductase
MELPFRYTTLDRLNVRITQLLARYSVDFLRISLGLVFLGFGFLKFFPGVSPAADLAGETMEALTLGLIPSGVGVVLVAMLETAIGVCLITGKFLRLGLALLGVAMVGILSPLVLLPGELFDRPYEPTLEGQYVLKDIVLLAAGLVVTASVKLGRNVADRD